MTSNQVMYFLAIVKYKTFTLAAEELYISQSSLSKQIKALEQELGYKLFTREGKENILTKNGQIFLEYAEDFSKNYSHLLSRLNNANKHAPKKSISLGILPVISEYNIHNDLAIFQSLIASSNIYINLIEDMQDNLMDMLNKRKIDSAIVRTDFLNLDEYRYAPIISEALEIVYHDKIKDFDEDKYYSLSEIVNYPLIVFEKTSSLYRTIDNMFKDEHLSPQYIYIYQRHEQILSMVNAGFGITIMPARLIDTDVYPHIRIAHLKDPIITNTGLVALKNIPISKSLDLLFKYFESSDP